MALALILLYRPEFLTPQHVISFSSLILLIAPVAFLASSLARNLGKVAALLGAFFCCCIILACSFIGFVFLVTLFKGAPIESPTLPLNWNYNDRRNWRVGS